MLQKFTHFIILLGVLFLPDMVYSKEYTDKIIAIVNDKVILKSEVQESINNLSSDIIKKEYNHLNEEEIINKVIDKLINHNLLLQAAERFSINISDIALEQEVNNIAKEQNVSITQLRNNIIKSGQDYTKFIENLRNKMTIEALFVTQFYSRANVTEEEVENFLKREQINEAGNVEYDLREFVIIDEKKEINKDLINQIYLSVTNNGFTQTKKIFEDISIDINVLGISKAGALPDIFVTALKNKKLDKYTEIIGSSKGYHILEVNNVVNRSSVFVNEYKVRHILLIPDIMTTDAETQKKLNELRNQISDLDSFINFAKKYSQDKGSGFKGGNIGWVRKKSVVPEFGEVMMKTPTKKISDPFKSRFGWHILYIENIRSVDDTKTLIRKNVAKRIRMQKAEREREDWMAKLKDQAFIELKEF
jgi:peptidyl-prolyl cis-trans isomerase SurA